MSAAAIPPLRTARPPVPVPALPGGWVPVPRRLLERVGPALSKVERAVVDLVLLRTIGDDEHGRSGRRSPRPSSPRSPVRRSPASTKRSDGFEETFKAIESQTAGRRKRYRLAVENFAEVEKPAPQKLTRKPPASEGLEAAPEPPQVVESANVNAPKPILEYGYSQTESAVVDPAGKAAVIELSQAVHRLKLRNRTFHPFSVSWRGIGEVLEITIAEAPPPNEWPPGYVDECRVFLEGFIPALHYASLIQEPVATVPESPFRKSYDFFKRRLRDPTEDGGKIDPKRILEIVEKRLMVVMINLSETDDPYLIFESLNFKGSPLEQADLVRNYFLMRFPVTDRNSVALAIEHRLFSFITKNWRGKPLVSHEVIVNLIAATTTRTGLRVQSQLDTGKYQKGIKVGKQEFAAIHLRPDTFHGEWNYAIMPR